MSVVRRIAPELVWTGRAFESDVVVDVGADGRIAAVHGRADDVRGSVDSAEGSATREDKGRARAAGDTTAVGVSGGAGNDPTQTLPRRALIPGFVNAHSHAFQRGLRGLGERFPASGGDFWSWREAMYGLVDRLGVDELGRLCRQAFAEMRRAGITTVGEFHYIHHDASGAGFAFDDVVLEAARDVGIRIVLLQACYETGGIDAPLEGGQRRFDTGSLEHYWAQHQRLAERLGPLQTLGVVAHSIRAVPPDDFAALHGEAMRRGLVFHAHLEEQPAEIEACLDRYGKRPLGMVLERVDVCPRTTLVHCTHSAEAELTEYFERGGNVCICPLTEANLGDGLSIADRMLRAGGRLCLGTDSNARISMLEELRWLELGQRLRTQGRGALRDAGGHVAPGLMHAATLHGAQSLGLRAGRIEAGHHADFALIDLDAPSLAGCASDTLAEALAFGCGDDVIAATCVAGAWDHLQDPGPSTTI